MGRFRLLPLRFFFRRRQGFAVHVFPVEETMTRLSQGLAEMFQKILKDGDEIGKAN